MLLTVIKILLLVYLVNECLSYQYNSKTDYIHSKWRSKYQATTTPWSKNNYRYQITTSKPHHLRHSGYNSRYTKLDGVLHKLGSFYTTTAKPVTKPWNSYYHRTSNSDESILDNYDDLDYTDDDLVDELDKDDGSDYDKWDSDDEEKNNTDYQEEDEDDLLDEDKWQAEEATEAPKGTSSFTEMKWKQYGTRARVEETRRQKLEQAPSTVENGSQAAVAHYLRVLAAATCSTPSPKVLNVQNEHRNPGKTYLPHCTILHRCTEDSGCCLNHSRQCGPKNQTLVYLYFYVYGPGTSGIEKLPFYNHTECECMDKSQLTSESGLSTTDNSISSRNSISLKSGSHTMAENLRRCKCPGEFVPNYRYHHCACDCSSRNLDCERMKRGKEYFSLKDRLCIKSGQCGLPICEYGKYLKDLGRCPKKQEKNDTFGSVRPN